MIFALIGNQNCGKTTLFNVLTGSNRHVGNFPGVTVERKDGEIKGEKGSIVVDLPGIYSLSPYTAEEIVTRDFLLNSDVDGIINILDATNIERNLYLTMQLTELDIPMVLALNMMDEVRANGNYIDAKGLENELGVPVIPISASRNEGIDELVERATKTAEQKRLPMKNDFCSGPVHKAIHSTAHLIEDKANAAGIPVRFAATKLAEGDELMSKTLGIGKAEADIIEHIMECMEMSLGTDREAALADMRYSFIRRICDKNVVKHGETREQMRSVRIDRVLTNKYLAIPLFFGIMLAVFRLTFGVAGRFLNGILENAVLGIKMAADSAMTAANINSGLHSLVLDGVIAGVGSVLSFMPSVLVLFFFLSMLEDSGYMARIAFVMDKPLRKIGLSGKSFVPMLIGFGCSVPAVMATRTLSSERDKKMTVMLIPFMSCSAKLPVYTVFATAFFGRNHALVMILLYVFGMAAAAISGYLLKDTVFGGSPVPFVMELPAYRIPSVRSVFLHMCDRAKDFIQKAFTIIFLASIIIWALQNFDTSFNWTNDSSKSLIAAIGRTAVPIFRPLGFGDWRAVAALLTGLTAKETVISTFAVLTGADRITEALTQMFTPAGAVSFLVFTLLYMPCVAAFSVIKREIGGLKTAVFAMLYQTSAAWVAAYVVYNICKFIFW